MKILIAGHGCCPGVGSEPGVTWNWAVHLAADNDVWVITHEHFKPAIEAFLAEHPCPRLSFVYTGRLGWFDPLRLPSQRGIRLHYVLWRWRVLRLARALDAQHDFDIVHHISWATVSAPPLLWQVGKPFVWGPVGGGQVTPGAFLRYFGLSAPLEMLRTFRIRLLSMLPNVRRAASAADAVFAVNRETAQLLRQAGAAEPILFLDVGTPAEVLKSPPLPRPVNGPFSVLWAGRIEAFKGIGLFLEAAALVTSPDIRFDVVGDGAWEANARQYARKLGLDGKVRFHGRLSHKELLSRFETAHLFVFTSLRDTFGNTSLEALIAGAPVICIDHNGVGTHLPREAAVKIPVTTPAEVASRIAQAVSDLAEDRVKLARMAEAGLRYARSVGWEKRADAMQAHYKAILARRHHVEPAPPSLLPGAAMPDHSG
ncbi:glycosyltransferase family 4 protein [Dankookia sp. P2]|uniref:glycosyltransferase family 4 protein n=1 Tax=Dankookia sp. P2 TaxID=3423955 RepID=UPI003D67FC91